jgi:hypothetical protein
MQQQSASAQPWVASVYSYNPAAAAPAWAEQAPLPDVRAGLAAATGPDGLVYAIGGMTCPQQVIVGEVEAYTFDKCDYLEYQIGVLGQQEASLVASFGELPPNMRAGGEKELIALRAQMANLEKALQACRG